jgi:hypothetical protein
MTAEEFLNQEQYYAVTSGDEYEICQFAIDFAKMHVELALKEAYNCAELDFPDLNGNVLVNKKSILNAYPLTNVK